MTRLGIMQPYFFPYLGYFQLIHAVDRWVILDNVQHIRRGWVSRNRILGQADDWTYLVIPVRKHSLTTQIRDVLIRDLPAARQRILAQLAPYKRQAPRFSETFEFVQRCLSFEATTLAQLNTHILKECCDLLGLKFDYCFASELEANSRSPVPAERKERLFWLGDQVGANVHVYPPGARELYDKADFRAHGIDLRFLSHPKVEYEQGGRSFVPDLSVIDVLMWNTLEETRVLLTQYSLE